MDHGGQFQREGRVMSQLEVGGVDLCDNLSNPEALAALNQNLNEANVLTKNESLSHSQNEDTGGSRFIQDASFCNIGTGECTGPSNVEDEEEDIDEVMKEDEEEEEESEGSSCPIRCQSPDTPMTDSSYSETGSLLETPYPFSPGTSPEPTSPVIPVVSPETEYHISQDELSQNDIEVDSKNANPEPLVSNMGSSSLAHNVTAELGDSTSQTLTSDPRPTSPPGPTDAADRIANCTSECTSSTTTISSQEFTITSAPETFTETACTTKINTSTPSSPMSTTAGLATTGTISSSTTGPITSNCEHVTSTPVPTCFSVSARATGSIPNPALLETLEQLGQRGDDTHLPQHLHQIAEAFVLHEDYQRAICCIQLERLYHQRVLDNLNALQEQWESRCKRTSSDLATQHLDKLTHICQTHSRPTAGDAEFAPMDIVRPTFEEGGALALCTTAHQLDSGTELRPEDSSHQSRRLVEPSINLGDGSNSPEISAKDREDPDWELEAGACFPASQPNNKQASNREGGEVGGGGGYTISTSDNKLHPSTAGGMEQSKPAEQQGGDSGLAQEKEAKREEEERDIAGAAEVPKMEDDGEEEEEGEEKQKERVSPVCQKALPVETLVSGEKVEIQQLHQEDSAEEKLHEDTQESSITCLHPEVQLPQDVDMKQQEEGKEEEQEEEEEEYELEQADIIREAATLDDMAKLITVEEISPASGLVSILKRRNVCVENVSVSASSRPERPPAKRRVHFKVPDDGYEQEVGGGDSCLLLFLLCLVTVVISVGGTALYCALGDAHSSVCQDFSRNADFYTGQIQRGLAHLQHWFTPGS